MINFIDYVRLPKKVLAKKYGVLDLQKENVKLEILARHVAEYIGINPDMSNARLATAFAKKLESKMVG